MQHTPDRPVSHAYLRRYMLYAVRKRRQTEARLTMHDAGTRERLRPRERTVIQASNISPPLHVKKP